MKRAAMIAGVIALLAIASFSLRALYQHMMRPAADQCSMCRRPIHPGMAFAGATADGKKQNFCCPRCWVTSQRIAPKEYSRLTATDYLTRKTRAAQDCVYVEGSDVSPCTAPAMTIGADKMPATEQYDRCFPSTLAFAKQEDAEQFVRAHGGKIVSFQELVDEAKRQ